MDNVFPFPTVLQSRGNRTRYRSLKMPLAAFLASIVAASALANDFAAYKTAAAPERIQEAYEKWLMTCLPRNGKRVCAVRQIQADRQTGKPVLMVELRAATDGSARGGIMLPAGLRREAGARVVLDGNAAGQVLPIRNCSQKGCAVTVTFAGAAFEKLRNGKLLQILTIEGNGSPRAFRIDLGGLSKATERALHLEKQ